MSTGIIYNAMSVDSDTLPGRTLCLNQNRPLQRLTDSLMNTLHGKRICMSDKLHAVSVKLQKRKEENDKKNHVETG